MSFRHFLIEVALGPLFINFTHIGGSGAKNGGPSHPEEDAQTYLEARLKHARFVGWNEVTVTHDDLTVDGVSVKRFPFVVVGVMGKHFEMGATVKRYLQENKVRHLLYGQPPEAQNKITATVALGLKKVPQIKTIIGTGEVLKADELVKQLKLPLVSKITDGSKGRGIEKHESVGSVKKLLAEDPEKAYIFQEFVPNDGDFRVFYIGRKKMYVLKRTRTTDEFRNNTSLGGKAEMQDDLPAEALKVALSGVDAMGYDISGVDLIQHQRTKKWFVMEVNAGPQFGGKELPMILDEVIKIISAK